MTKANVSLTHKCGLRLAAATAAILFSALPGAQGNTAYDITPDSIHRHIAVLAHDSLEGREVGEIGEWKAAQYIMGVFRDAGLEPKGSDSGYLQPFEFTKAIDFGPANHLTVNGAQLQLGEEFSPLRQSANGPFSFGEVVFVDYGIVVDEADGDYDNYRGLDVAGKAVVIKRFAPARPDSSAADTNGINFDRYAYLTDKINTAIEREAGAVFLITPEDMEDTLTAIGPTRINPKEIPIIFLRHKALERLKLDLSAPEIRSVEGETELIKTRDTGYNVVGYLPGETDTTAIIGAHYDHLGWGTETSRYHGKEKMIHNGADDNASGTATMLELARFFSGRSAPRRYSLLFIAFSGEEAGILGSSYYARNMTIDSGKVRMMVNLDMIGRLREQEGLMVFGTGSATQFKDYFDSLEYDKFKITHKESGFGGSDHMAFYSRGIPVLFFFTGAHADYHKPTDDIEKIDFEGTAAVGSFVAEVVTHFDNVGNPLTYQRTKGPERGRHSSQYSVTLGITPDFIAEVKGLRVDAVSPDRPADWAGILKGDVIIRMGDISVGDIYDYMSALGRFRKGDSATVIVEREADTLHLPVVFE
ncbi:MAG: M28 family peptidase [candidate division Zixibacteria bacterium]|nr:M28 family peptidase [candidate division Zixibacteria bacterium]